MPVFQGTLIGLGDLHQPRDYGIGKDHRSGLKERPERCKGFVIPHHLADLKFSGFISSVVPLVLDDHDTVCNPADS